MATIRALWNSGGELVTRDSPYFPLRDALFDLPPYRGKWPEIWIAAHGPRMLRATGRYGDGFYPAFPHRPEGYKQRLDAVRSAASDAGRDPESIIPAVQLFVITGRTHEDVDEAIDSQLIRAFALNAPDELFSRHGARHPMGTGFSGHRTFSRWRRQQTAVLCGCIRPPVIRDGAYAEDPRKSSSRPQSGTIAGCAT